jgi:pilus assembly protein CpaE
VIVDECQSWQPLQEHLRMGQVDLVALNLDAGSCDAAFHTLQRIAEVSPECGTIGISRDASPDRIIGAMRSGCGQFVKAPVDPQDLRDAIHRLRRVAVPAGTSCQRVCVVGSSGGAGATTVACNLAFELAQATERRCAIIDMNLQFGDVACAFDVSAKHSVSDVCGPSVEIDRTLIEMALEELPCKVSVLARPERIEGSYEVAPEKVFELFRILEQMFPFVVVDLPRHFGPASMSALNGADRVFLVTQLAVPIFRNALRMYDYLVGMGANEDRIELVLNRTRASHERVKPQEIEKQFGKPVFAVIPNDYKHIGASRDLGHPLMSDAPNSPARMAIQQLAVKIAAANLGEEALDGANASLFSKLTKRFAGA